EELPHLLLEALPVGPGGQPEVERRLDQVGQLTVVVDSASVVDLRRSRHERRRRVSDGAVLADEIEDLAAQRLRALHQPWRRSQRYGIAGVAGSSRSISPGSWGSVAQLATIAGTVPTPLKPFQMPGGIVTSASVQSPMHSRMTATRAAGARRPY